MTTKYQSVVRPHENTFDWIFESNEISRPLDKCLSNIPQKSDDSENKRFREWLRTNSFEGWMRSKTTKNVNGNINNLYWIVGKAGSGKSTLMKHIFKHPKTEQRLSHWKGTNQLLQVGYFFERGHSSEERLLRTLLHQILIYDESIIVSVYKELWEQFSKFKGIRGKRPDRPAESISDVRTSRFKEEGIESAVLDVDSLFDALSRAAGLICASTKLFFLIDGLDEIVGVGEDSEEDQMTAYEKCQSLSKMIAKMAENENIKMCVSSRPHLGFEDEEGGLSEHPRLELEKATGPDITHYVDSQLGQNTRFAHMARDDPQSAKELCQDIKDKASGMFLWVSLVVKILIDGVNHRSRMHDLKRKLQLLPKEMTGENGLYMQMLKSVGHGQLEERGRIVLILIQSFRMGIPLSPLLLDFAEEEGEIEDLIHEKNSKKFDAKRSLQRVKDRLKGCCGGIFEVKSIAPPSNGTEQDIFTDLTVDAIHGTVWEFLGEPVALVEWMWYPREECVPDSLTSLIRSAILCLHFMPPTTTENCKELAKVCIDLVMEATVSIENHSWCSSEIHEEQDALCQTGRDSIRTVSKLISVFDQVGSKTLEKTRRYFESSEKHWIYLMDTKVFDYYDDYESYMVSSLLNVGSVFCVEHLLFDDQYKKVYNRNKSPISHALSCYLNLWGPEFESLAGTLRSIICRLAREKQHYIIITSIFEERGKRYKSYWIQLLSERPSDDEPSACKIRYLETLELLIENVPNLLETPLGKARNVADVLEHFGDVAEKRDEVLERIKPTLKQQESLCTLM